MSRTWAWPTMLRVLLLACGAGASLLTRSILDTPPEALSALSLVPTLLGHSTQPRLFVIGDVPWLTAFLGHLPVSAEVTLLTHFNHALSQRMTREDALVMVSEFQEGRRTFASKQVYSVTVLVIRRTFFPRTENSGVGKFC